MLRWKAMVAREKVALRRFFPPRLYGRTQWWKRLDYGPR